MFVQLPSRRRAGPPWATLLIVAACVVAFLWLVALPATDRLAVLTRWGTVPSTLLDQNVPWWQQLLELRAARLVTAIFFHADWLHLTGNLLFLIVFGVSAERALGSSRFLLMFVVGGALANLVGALTLAGTSAPIIGSSGAVSAVVGAYLALVRALPPRRSAQVSLGLLGPPRRRPRNSFVHPQFAARRAFQRRRPAAGIR